MASSCPPRFVLSAPLKGAVTLPFAAFGPSLSALRGVAAEVLKGGCAAASPRSALCEIAVPCGSGSGVGVGLVIPERSVVEQLRWDCTLQDFSVDLHFGGLIERAAAWRRSLLGLPSAETNCFRLLNGVADGTPDAAADVFGTHVQARFGSVASQALIRPILEKFCAENKLTLQRGEFERGGTSTSSSPSSAVVFRESGVDFNDAASFHVAGRQMRSIWATMCRGKRVMDVSAGCISFAAIAAHAGASSLACVVPDATTEQRLNSLIGRGGLSSSCEIQVVMPREAVAKTLVRDFELISLQFDDNSVDGSTAVFNVMSRAANDGLLFLSCYGKSCGKVMEREIPRAVVAARREAKIVNRIGPSGDFPLGLQRAASSAPFLGWIISMGK